MPPTINGALTSAAAFTHRALIRIAARILDKAVLHARYLVEDFDAETGSLLRRQEFEQNCFLNEGVNELWTLLCGTGATKFDNANAYIGVGDSDTAADASQTGLQAASNKLYKAMDSGYPTYGTSQKATFRSTFGTSEANWAWKEITVANGNSDSAKNLNRKVQDMGTKTSAVSRQVTVELSIA